MCQQAAASRVRPQVSQSRTWVVEEVPKNARSIPLVVDSKPSPGVGVVTGASEQENPQPATAVSSDDIRAEKVAGEVDNIVSTIRLVGKSEYLANPILLDALLTKLSVNLRQQWGEYTVEMRGRPMDLGVFNDWLQDRVEAIGFMGERLADAEEIQLHLMCDASEKAYAAVACIRVKKSKGVEVSLAVARANVAPVKCSTIPRMELQAAVSKRRRQNKTRRGCKAVVTGGDFRLRDC
ncbi:hypothetical protein GE061_013284 [Apolygus lucorum]|uniref:Uncharacterized protein n=1 Tax=Apolygus lucorum TaxID=248454 RepID=A0A8S9XM88_APOLU|nr:hypothetical protein GE061_013284 [Apolygus lucorum]